MVIYYSWGNQQEIEHLAHAAYEGSLGVSLKDFSRRVEGVTR
jgi:hypothetical protein